MDLQYLAGILDGEGHIGIVSNSQGRYSVRIQVGNTHFGLIKSLHENYGGWVDHVTPRNPKWRPFGLWYISGGEAVNLLARVEPFLVVKKLQALVVQKVPRFVERRRTHWTAQEQAEAAEARLAIKVLNRPQNQPLKG